MSALLTKLRESLLLLADGAWGSHAIEAGLDLKADCADAWNLTQRDFVAALARNYVQAGVDILTTNTFGANRVRLARLGRASDVHSINRHGVAIAQAASRRREATQPTPLIAGAMGPARGPGETRPDDAELSDVFLEQATSLLGAGADLILLETITDHTEAGIAVRAAKAAGDPFVVCSFAFQETTPGHFDTWSGETVEAALAGALEAGADLVGANCVPATEMLVPLVRDMRRVAGTAPLWLKPNAGVPVPTRIQTPDEASPKFTCPKPLADAPIEAILDALETGVIGGCCGTTPADIAALRATLDRRTGHR